MGSAGVNYKVSGFGNSSPPGVTTLPILPVTGASNVFYPNSVSLASSSSIGLPDTIKNNFKDEIRTPWSGGSPMTSNVSSGFRTNSYNNISGNSPHISLPFSQSSRNSPSPSLSHVMPTHLLTGSIQQSPSQHVQPNFRLSSTSIQQAKRNIVTPSNVMSGSQSSPPLLYRNSRMALCPHCNKSISCVGSNFVIHLSKCDPNYFFLCVLGDPDFSVEDFLLSAEEDMSSFEVARGHALERFKSNIDFMLELFSTSESVDEIIQSISIRKNDWDYIAIKQRITELEEEIQKLVEIHTKKIDRWQKTSQTFVKSLKRLRNCSNYEEMEKCIKTFENEFQVRFEKKRNIDNNSTYSILVPISDDSSEQISSRKSTYIDLGANI